MRQKRNTDLTLLRVFNRAERTEEILPIGNNHTPKIIVIIIINSGNVIRLHTD